MVLNLFGQNKVNKERNNLQTTWILQLTVEFIVTFVLCMSLKQNWNDILEL